MDTDSITVKQMPKKSRGESLIKIINYVLLCMIFIWALGLASFYYTVQGIELYERVLLIAWLVAIVAATVFKEIKVKSLGKRVLLSIALYLGFSVSHGYLFLIW